MLRITIAREQWGTATLVASTTGPGDVAVVPLDHSDAFEHVDIALGADAVDAVGSDGVDLRVVGAEPVHVFGAGGPFAPRLLGAATGDPVARFLDGIASPVSLQAFGWKLGCVLDGLDDLHRAIGDGRFEGRSRAHLAEYFGVEGELTYQDPWGEVRQGEIYGIEGLLPLAALARSGDAATAIRLCERFLAGARGADGAIRDDAMLSTEGMYTVASPLAVLGVATGRRELLVDAAHQLRLRIAALREGGILLRRYEDGRVEFRDWIRAWTWYLLGLARAVPVLAQYVETADLATEFESVCREALVLRGGDGLWRTYPKDASTPVETSGSAGIAAAFALGARAGILGPEWADEARSTADALLPWVGGEGVLGGASQANKGGERLQRSPHRVNSQVGMGLLGQLLAALPRGVPRSAQAPAQ
jgi:rhamnogalacturonyl hydrolase YesR